MFQALFPLLYGGFWSFLICGCRMRQRDGTVPLRGTVKLDGRPLANATVYFIAQNSGGRDALGTTDAKGVFRLSTLKSGDGAFPGRYKVVVQPVAPADAGVVATTPGRRPCRRPAQSGSPHRPAVVIPPRYSQPDQTILVQDVPASREVVFELQSK